MGDAARQPLFVGFRGRIDTIEPRLQGWVVDTARWDAPVRLSFRLDGDFEASVTADIARPDVAAAGLGPERCGFAIELPPTAFDSGEHELSFALANGLRLGLPAARRGWSRPGAGGTGVAPGRGVGVVAITVLEGYRRKRIGEAMLRALLDAAAGPCAMHEVWLSVRQNNIPAIRLYEKLGFVRRTDRPAGDWAAADEIAMAWLSPVILYPQKS